MNQFKITLVRPNYHSHLITPPLGLGYLSSYLKARGYAPEIIDGLNLGYSNETIAELCQGADLVGINCLSAYYREVIQLSKELKKRNLRVLVGGPHACALPELTLKETGADYVAIGEGEFSLFQLIKSIEEKRPAEGISGILTRVSEKITKSPLIEDLDSLPYPDWQQIDPRTYKRAPHGGLVKGFPVAPIISTRGCPFECTFCASPSIWNRKVRFRSPENVVDEIENLVNNFNVKEIHFEDDNLTLKRSHIEKICNLILEKNIKVNWATPNGIRIDTIDPVLLELMKKSGCYFIAFGIESGNQEILNRVKKRTSLEAIEMAVRLVKRAGIVTQGFFILGLPGETEETINETIRFAKRLPLDKAQFLILDVLPGSELWNELKKGRSMNWDYRSYHEASWIPDGLSKESLDNALGCAFRSFFLRPKQIFFLLRYLKPSQIPFVIRRAADFNMLPFLKSLQGKR